MKCPSLQTLIAMAALCFSLLLGVHPAAARLDVEEFAKGTRLAAPALSPSGRYLAQAMIVDEKKVVIGVFDLDAPGSKPTGTTLPKGLSLDFIRWANDDRLLIGGSQYGVSASDFGVYYGVSRIVAIDRDGKNMTVLFNNLSWLSYNAGSIGWLHPLPREPDYILMHSHAGSAYDTVYRVNVRTGKADILVEGTSATFRWLTDLDGVPRVRWDGDSTLGRIQVFLRRGDSENWDLVAQYSEKELPDLNIIGFADDPKMAIVASRLTNDKFGIYEYNVITRQLGRKIFDHPNIDVGSPAGGPVHDPYTTRLLGVSYVDDLWFMKFFEPDLAAVQEKVEAGFASDAIVRLVSWSEDRKRFVVFTEGARNPGSYFLFDAVKNTATALGKTHPNLPENELGDTLVIKYTARDGARIPGYLTMPPGKGDKNLPLIVMPHGGPELRDYVQYDAWVQLLANRGYAVLQPNFRGSGGYGRDWTQQGYRQWGRRMQDDISDGVKALVKDGTADAKRVCIVGASYGGYAALAGGAFSPELYKCVVSIAGVSDLVKMMAEEKEMRGSDSESYHYWIKWVGDPKTDAEEMKAWSPALHADKFVAPVLLIHGAKDKVDRYEQSMRMEKALTLAGKQVKLVKIESEGHSFSGPGSQKLLMSELEKFLAAQLGD